MDNSRSSSNPWRGNGNNKKDKLAPPSNELGDFHIYNKTKTWPRPHFHVLVDARRHQEDPANLCRTVLSAVAQGYPPPILVGYRAENEELTNNQVSSTESFLNAALDAIRLTKNPQQPPNKLRPPAKDQESVILFLGQNQWIQMPAEVTARRFLQHKDALSQRWKRKYALLSSPAPDSSGFNFTQKGQTQTQTQHNKNTYKLGVLFPASKRRRCRRGQQCKVGNSPKDNTENKEKKTDRNQKPTSSQEDSDDMLPESSLPEDVYGVFPDSETSRWWRKKGHGNDEVVIPIRYQRPRYLGGGSFMGEVGDVERLLKGAVERLGWLGDNEGKQEGSAHDGGGELTYLFSEMFYEQEIERRRLKEVFVERNNGGRANLEENTGWLSGLWGLMGWKGDHNGIDDGDQTDDFDGGEGAANPDEYEFSIGLDYESRIFQEMAGYQDSDNTTTPLTTDIRFLTFTRPNLVKSPSRTASHLYRDPLRLPPELLHPFSPGGRSSPFGLVTTRYNLSEILKAASQAVGEELPREGEDYRSEMIMVSWPKLEFATNVVVPRGSVPSVLDMGRFAGLDTNVQADSELDKYWGRMWFNQKQDNHDGDSTKEQSYTPVKDLLNEYLHPNRYIYALEAAEGGRTWWNLRGGRGGLWTDQGVCVYFRVTVLHGPLFSI